MKVQKTTITVQIGGKRENITYADSRNQNLQNDSKYREKTKDMKIAHALERALYLDEAIRLENGVGFFNKVSCILLRRLKNKIRFLNLRASGKT